MVAMKRTFTGLGWVAAALMLLAAQRMGSEWGADYSVAYGTFTLSPGESALRLNQLLLVLPACLALAWGMALLMGERLRERFEALVRSGRAWEAGLALWLLLATWTVRTVLLQGAEVTDDENAYTFQARLLEGGRFFVPSLPAPFRDFLDNQFVVNDGRRYATYFLGHPTWLAAFRRLGLPDLAGPVAVALTALLTLAIARRIFGARAAALTAGLLATSPFLILLGATHLSQPTTGLFTTTYLYGLVRVYEAPTRAHWWMLGAASISAAMLTRPQSAVAFLLVGVGALAVAVWRGELTPGFRPILAGLGVGMLGVVLLLWLNAVRTGDPLRTSYAAYLAQGAPWIFPVGPGYSIRQAAESLGHLQFWLFGWPISLLFLPFFKPNRLALLAAGLVAATAVLFACFAIPTVAPVGPVYYGESIPILAMLSASGVERAVEWARDRLARPTLAAALAVGPLCCTALGLATFLPPQLVGLERSAAIVRLPYDLTEELGPERAVIFAGELPTRAIQPWSWAYYHRSADPDLADQVIFVRDLGAERNRAFLAWLRDRRGYTLVRTGVRFALEPLGAR